jgi:hypothetical protein
MIFYLKIVSGNKKVCIFAWPLIEVVLLYPNLNNGQMTANPDIATKVVYEMATHKAQAVIFIRFEYDASLIARVKKLVGVRWSQSQKA